MDDFLKISDIFGKYNEKGERQLSFSPIFTETVLKPNLNEWISIKNARKLKYFGLMGNMKNSDIQSYSGWPGYMPSDDFFLIMYILIFHPDKAKEILNFSLDKSKIYVLHIKSNGKSFSVRVHWQGSYWHFADKNDYEFDWNVLYVFIYFPFY